MTTTKPSAGATRAAEAYMTWKGENRPQYIEDATLRLAAIIDRESGLVEALDALRGMIGLVQLIQAREPDLQNNHRFIEAIRVLSCAASRDASATVAAAEGNATACAGHLNPNADIQQMAPLGRWTEKKGTA